MAIFTDQGGKKQDERIQFRQATGWNKAKLAMLGFDASGNRNTFGKIASISPGMSGMQRIAANQAMSKNSDVGRQIKSTNKEGLANNVAVLDFAGEVAKTALTFGAGGAAGAAGGGAAGAGAGGAAAGGTGITGGIGGAASGGAGAAAGTSGASVAGAGDAVSAAGSGGGMESVLSGGGGDVSSMMSGGPSDGSPALDLPSSSSGAGFDSTGFDGADSVTQANVNTADPYSSALDSDAGKKLIEMQEDSAIEDTKDALEKDKKDEEAKKKKNENLNKAVESAPALISKGVKVYTTQKALSDAEKANLKKAQGRTQKAEYGNYL